MKLSISLERFLQRLEEDLFTSLENIHCDEARFRIRLEQNRYHTSANFEHPPPISLFHIHNRLHYERLIFRRLGVMAEKAREQHARVEKLVCDHLTRLPKEFINIVFNWTVEDMEEQEDKEAILFLNELKDQNFWPNEE